MTTTANSEAKPDTKKTAPNPFLRTVHEALDELPISRSSLYALMASGRLKRIKIGGRTFLSAAELERVRTEGTAA